MTININSSTSQKSLFFYLSLNTIFPVYKFRRINSYRIPIFWIFKTKPSFFVCVCLPICSIVLLKASKYESYSNRFVNLKKSSDFLISFSTCTFFCTRLLFVDSCLFFLYTQKPITIKNVCIEKKVIQELIKLLGKESIL